MNFYLWKMLIVSDVNGTIEMLIVLDVNGTIELIIFFQLNRIDRRKLFQLANLVFLHFLRSVLISPFPQSIFRLDSNSVIYASVKWHVKKMIKL